MINVIASVEVKDGCLSEFLKIFKSNVPTVLREQGCIEYLPAMDATTDIPPQVLNENIITIIEKWATVEDLQVHLSAPHMLAYREKVKNFVEKVTLKVLKEV